MRKMLFVAAFAIAAGQAGAQTPAHDPGERLRAVLPAEVVERVLARIEAARARELPTQALEHRALELAAKGASASRIERAIDAHADAMARAREALQGRGSRPTSDELTAGGDAILRGIDGRTVAELARTAPADRSMAVPLYVLTSMMDRGMPVETALAHVKAGLAARDSDAELQSRADGLPAVADERRGAARDGAPGRPVFAGPPAGLPANPGARGKPATVPRDQTPPPPPPGGPPPLP